MEQLSEAIFDSVGQRVLDWGVVDGREQQFNQGICCCLRGKDHFNYLLHLDLHLVRLQDAEHQLLKLLFDAAVASICDDDSSTKVFSLVDEDWVFDDCQQKVQYSFNDFFSFGEITDEIDGLYLNVFILENIIDQFFNSTLQVTLTGSRQPS